MQKKASTCVSKTQPADRFAKWHLTPNARHGLIALALTAASPALAHTQPHGQSDVLTLPAPAPVRAIGFGDSLGLSPFSDWKTIETEHFRVTFPAELEEIAQRTANLYEEAHAFLAPHLKWEPKNKVQVTIVDNADSANGLTTPIGRFGMVLMVTPPDNWFSTAYYEDWLRLLVIHEYTHFLNMDITRGFWDSLRYVLGDVLLPNSTWPMWMLEGLAVYMETRYTRAGRGRSPFYEMVLRASVIEEKLDDPSFITLDKVNGPNPYYPGGETAYLFGYQLMNQVARDSRGKTRTDDQESLLEENKNGDSALGMMSWRSGHRVPYFINGNLENITGKDWYTYWNEWTLSTRDRVRKQVQTIHKETVTQSTALTEKGYAVYGTAVSPDNKWLVYTHDSLHRRQGLYLRNVSNGETTRLTDKMMGVGIAFTPDSARIVMSGLRQYNLYKNWSELGVHDLNTGKTHWITSGLRARDPDLTSKIAKNLTLTFTITENGRTGLALAELIENGAHYELGPVKKLYMPQIYDRVSTPKFSPDGKTIAFSMHRNGLVGDELMAYDLESGKIRTLVQNGKFNRFPTYHSDGSLYFISDRSGVDNLYQYREASEPEQFTNMLTGIWFPTFSNDQKLYASVMSTGGWDLAQVEIASTAVNTAEVTIDAPPAPEPDALSVEHVKSISYPVKYYSVIPSIWPRQWAPLAFFDQNRFYFGGNVLGFDALDRHRYVLGGAYDTLVKKPDWLAIYSNRSLGPTLTFSGSQSTSSVVTTRAGDLAAYIRSLDLSFDISYPFQWTWSSLVPSFSINAEREFLFEPALGTDEPTAKSRYVPSADLGLTYSNTQGSRLAISPEGGRTSEIATRAYNDSGRTAWKALITDREYIRIGEHSVLTPSAKASWTSRRSDTFASSNVVVRGRLDRLADSFLSESLDQLPIRGYPTQIYLARAAGIGALDYRFPIDRIFRGWGTQPAFANYLWGFAFAESGVFPRSGGQFLYLPSAGTGVRLHTTLFIHIPLIFALEYHHGFNRDLGGKGEAFFVINSGSISF